MNKLKVVLVDELLMVAISVVLAGLLIGCGLLQEVPVEERCKDAFLAKQKQHYKVGALVITIANARAIEDDYYTKEQALEALEQMKAMLQGEITYARFATYVISKIEWVNEHAGTEVMILADFIADMQSKQLAIHPCDAELMLKDVESMIFYTKMM